MPNISIIIPVYNVGQYLEKCIESVINQTYKDIEIICVDDGSKDISSEICDKYGEMDSRIKVIHKTNEGPVSARQAGLKKQWENMLDLLMEMIGLTKKCMSVCFKQLRSTKLIWLKQG